MVRSSIKNKLIAGAAALALFASCKNTIQPDVLYGKWKYVKIENNSVSSTTNVTSEQLESEEPYIQFSKNDSLLIWWGGKVLSHGSYKIEGDKIQFKEILADGKTREFPFIVSKLDDKNLIFETTGDDGARVTTVKE
ncbi:hypothetical protein ACPPVU_07325 [Mucilaginibacter sp. McL0603]|uniref:hypothetical protein n=1 Tax=Mucilaginibacter sp. McL0603 TaxID=3415670 RepID=UPI003CF6BEC2